MNQYLISHERVEPGRKEMELLSTYPLVRASSAREAQRQFFERSQLELGDGERIWVRRIS
jgi:hypothetical protein